MNKKKLIPIILIVILSIVAIVLFFYKKNAQNQAKEPYTKFVITYKGEKKEYEDLTTIPYIMIGEKKFTLGAVEPSRLIIYTDSTVIVNKKAITDVEIPGGKEYEICIEVDDCFTALYTR